MINFKIPGMLPGLNEYINAERGNRYKGAAMKKQTEHLIECILKSKLRGVEMKEPAIMIYKWFEETKRRDKDNISFAKKFVQDSLVKVGILKNDGWKEILHSEDFHGTSKNPRVEVTILTVEEYAQQKLAHQNELFGTNHGDDYLKLLVQDCQREFEFSEGCK